MKTFTFIAISFLLSLTNLNADILLVGNKNQATLSFIDLKNNSVSKIIKTGNGPHEIAVSPNQKYAVVVNYGTNKDRGDSVSLIEIETMEIINTFSHKVISAPHGLQWFNDNKHILVTAEDNHHIVKLNPLNGNIKGVAKTDSVVSHMLVISPDQSIAAVASMGSGDVSIIDLKTFKLIKRITTGKGAEGIDISADGKHLWVTNREVDTVTIINLQSLAVIKTLDSVGFPIRVKITSNLKYALVSNATANSLSIFDATTFELIKTLKLTLSDIAQNQQFPVGVLIDPNDRFAYIAHSGIDKISVIDLKSLERISIIESGPGPDGMGYVVK